MKKSALSQSTRRPEGDECFLVLAGKKTTANGCTLVAHNNDLHGTEAALLRKFPKELKRSSPIWNFSTGTHVSMPDFSYEYLILQIYLGFDDGDFAGINECQVAIAGGVSLLADGSPKARLADPLVYDGITAGIRLAALSCCNTARQCVEYLGKMYTEYGVSYPSGVGIADAQEIWYMEQGGGRTWAAVRVPDDCCLVAANGYRIGEIDPGSPDVRTSPDLIDFCCTNGLYSPADGMFNFSRIFGRGREKYTIDSRRIWGALRHLTPSVARDANAREFPLMVRPEEPLSVSLVAALLRDQYNETAYDIHLPASQGGERPIAVPGTVHSNIIELRKDLPASIGAVLWASLASPSTSPYIPFYFGIAKIPDAFSRAGDKCSRREAYWRFKIVSNLVTPYHKELAPLVTEKWQTLEQKFVTNQIDLHKIVSEDPDRAVALLTDYINEVCETVLRQLDSLENQLHTKIAAHSNNWLQFDTSW